MKKSNTRLKVLLGVLGLVIIYGLIRNPTDIKSNSVTITNREANHGGSGTIMESSNKGSYILTNRHVCAAVGDGGVVNGHYEIQSYYISQVSDLCLIYVSSNLHEQTKLASSEPKMFDSALISGHPALMPTVHTMGHFSDKAIINVMTEMKQCSQEDLQDPGKAMICLFFGGIPVVKSYESVLVTATIMPGSSGSGIYNSSNKLAAVVFAGQGDFGYSWSVPFDQVKRFLKVEVPKNIDNFKISDKTISLNNANDNKKLDQAIKNCPKATDINVVKICKVLTTDINWLK